MACKILISVAAAAAVWSTAWRPVHAQNAPPAAPATAPAAEGPSHNSPAALLGILSNPSPAVAQAERDEAARRLVLMDMPEAEDALQKALFNTGNPRGQQSVARALAEDPTPDPDYIVPLGALIGTDAASTEAAARALAHLRTSAGARQRLIAAASNRGLVARSREAVIRSLAPLADKPAAEALITIIAGKDELMSTRVAAADELAELTGFTELGRDPDRWQQWWAANRVKPDAQFETEMLAARAARLDRIEPRLDRLIAETRQFLRESFQDAPAANKEQVLLGYLRSTASDVRHLGADIMIDLFDSASPIPESARQQLRTMVGDSDEQVRLQAAAAIQRTNDVDALDAVLGQLEVERSPAVRAALAAALAPMGKPRAVQPLVRMLSDPNPAVVEAAANALEMLRDQLRDADAKVSGEVSRALTDALRRTGGAGADAAPLRVQVVEALVAWPTAGEDVRNTFVGLLRPNEPPEMRVLALRYFGKMGSDEPWPADNIVNSGALEDRSRDVRLAAVDALARTAQAANAQHLYERLSPEVETDEEVRDEAWKALAGLFPREFQIEQLNAWADKFRDDPPRRLTVLETLRDKLIADGRRPNELAVVRQNIGEEFAKMGLYERAAGEFESALQPGRGGARDLLVTQLVEAYLRAENYEKATQFGAAMIAENRPYQSRIGQAITNEAQRLNRDGEVDRALRLVGLALKMDPPLEGNFAKQLENLARQLRDRSSASTAPAVQ